MDLPVEQAQPASPVGLTTAIFCGPTSGPTAHLSLDLHGPDVCGDALELVTPARCEAALRLGRAELSIRIDEEIPGYAEVSRFLATHQDVLRRRGRSTVWYLQQYLKLAYVWDKSSWVFIQDGDTLFSPSLLGEMRLSPFLLTTREDITAYSATAASVGLPVYPRSFIANGGVFSPQVLRGLAPRAADWFIDVMQRAVLPAAGADFSEYQIMGALLARDLPIRPLRLFRRFDLLAGSGGGPSTLERARRALARYDAVAFEAAHQSSVIKRLAGQLAYRVGYTW